DCHRARGSGSAGSTPARDRLARPAAAGAANTIRMAGRPLLAEPVHRGAPRGPGCCADSRSEAVQRRIVGSARAERRTRRGPPGPGESQGKGTGAGNHESARVSIGLMPGGTMSTRRDFLKTAPALPFFARAALQGAAPTGRILVVLQLAGGNDG